MNSLRNGRVLVLMREVVKRTKPSFQIFRMMRIEGDSELFDVPPPPPAPPAEGAVPAV